MARAIELIGDLDAADFRRAASLSRDAGQSRRLLALAAVAEGRRREEAARIGGMGIVRANSFTLPKRQNWILRPLIFLHFSGSI